MADRKILTPPHLVARVLGRRSALEGERKHVTVLFADIEGSLALAERLDPETWHGLLDHFFRLLGNAVYRFEGTINQYTGDGIMALFGAPIAHEDHAQRACHAALRIRRDLVDLARQVKREHGLDLAARMGVNSGTVVVGKIGDDLRMDYTAQGPMVGVAARLQEIAAPGAAVLAAATADLVRDYFDLEALGPARLKGISTSVATFALKGTGAARTRLEAARIRGLSCFVGRDTEIAVLRAALERACSGLGQVVAIVGAAGMGKSRLCEELLAQCRADGRVAVHEIHCVAHAESISGSTLGELMRSLLGLGAAEDPRLASVRLTRRLTEIGGLGVDAEPTVRVLLGLPFAESASSLDVRERSAILTALLGALLRRESAFQPLAILIDDAHWIDGESERILSSVARTASGMRMLLLVNVRPGRETMWMGGVHCQQIGLAPLDEAGCAALTEDLLGGDPALVEIGARIRDHAGGNPFFVEEIVRSLRDTGVLDGARGAHTLGRSLDEMRIPPTVYALLGARIDALGDLEKHVLQTAAVIGKRFAPAVLEDVAELPQEALGRALAQLEDLDLVRLEGVHASEGYSFRHPLVQEVAYQSQLSDRRQRLHAATARALERISADRLGEHAGVIAQHWHAADNPSQARRWRRLAALRVTHIQPRRAETH